MADGAIQGPLRDIGQVLHTDGTQTVVATVVLPSTFDGIYYAIGRFTCSTATGTNDCVGLIEGQVRMDDGTATMMVVEPLVDMQSTGYSAALITAGDAVRLAVTAANGVRSVGYLEAFGVEMALTIG